ncbi:EAL domain-containing protein [Curvibacter sp. RS43]|uniref:EAL domain-containing protein n=1 Tax=Curvibacter microcysteis TaxID=3026419 RepID=A0ABT5MJA2_9BURK|nr:MULTISPECIES: EAL domain-containing protein [unclassified Curvibacter]MDD0810965.1 EAL domain-containing protein [Curvibacter sp. RS43]MDD0816079.1 EAL domain-containing protein [Curvibacter sp. HBC28]
MPLPADTPAPLVPAETQPRPRRLLANEQSVPRLHLIGTLLIVLGLTLALTGFFSWQNLSEQSASLRRMEAVIERQQHARLSAEMESALSYLTFVRSRTDQVLRQSLTSQVDGAMQVVESIYQHESPRRPAAEVKRLIIEALRQVRFFDGRGYYFIDDLEGRFVLLPTAPQLEGKLLPDNRDDTGHRIMQGLIEAAQQPRGQGFSRYRWYLPDQPKQMADKLAYVRHFAPYGWLIGAGDYTYKWEEQQQKEALDHLRSLRFGSSGYFGLIDSQGRSLLSPGNASLEGKHYSVLPPAEGRALEKMHQSSHNGGGFVRYEWPDPKTGQLAPKTALVKTIQPWGWVVAATVFDDELQEALNQERLLYEQGSSQRLMTQALAVLAALLVALGGSLLFSRWSRRLFNAYHHQNARHIAVLRQQAAELRTLTRAMDQSPVSILITDTSRRISYVNPEFERLSGYSAAEVLGQSPDFLRLSQRPQGRYKALWQALDAGQNWQGEVPTRCKDGRVLWQSVQLSPIFDDQGQAVQYLGILEDITERRHMDAELRIAATAFETQEGMMVADSQGVILKVNQAFCEITGYSSQDAVGQTPKLLKSGRHDDAFYANMWQAVMSRGQWRGEIWNRRKNGEIFPEWLTITAVKSQDGDVTHYVSTLTDITQRKAAENEIRHLAFFDPLTGLPNRRLLLDRLRQALASSQRRQRNGALIFIDLDNFKTLNDTLGHDKGDLLLKQVAQRLKAGVRETDTVSRLGGDEFVVMLEGLDLNNGEAARQAESVGETLREALNQAYDLNGNEYHCSPSMGITLFDRQSHLDEMLQRADLAMYQAKAAGRNTLRFFDPAMQALVAQRAAMEADLRVAIRDGQLLLYYQAQVSAAGQVVGAEALVRWRHPQQGLVSPADFIPLAEETGLILPLGLWVLTEGCRQLADWARTPERTHLTLAINVSARQYRQPDFVEQVLNTLATTGAPASRLKLELTESLLLHDVEDIITKMTALQAHGVGFSLDDFGTGYSSLSYLKRLPLDQLKIDQSFVRDLLVDSNDATIARTIVALGKNLGLSVIAEGVETAAQRDCLASYGCDAYQGYLYGRPGPAAELPTHAEV